MKHVEDFNNFITEKAQFREGSERLNLKKTVKCGDCDYKDNVSKFQTLLSKKNRCPKCKSENIKDIERPKIKVFKKNESLSLQELRAKYPEIKFTMDKKDRGYFVRADITDQGGETHYLGAIKGQVSEKDGLEFLNNIADKNYDAYY